MEGASVLNGTTFVGLDVHARSIRAVALDAMPGEARAATFGYDRIAVFEWVRSPPQPARCVYESGITGFDLREKLVVLGIDCVINAVSKMVKPAVSRRRKNDRNDAEFLVRMFSVCDDVATARELACWVWAVGCMVDRGGLWGASGNRRHPSRMRSNSGPLGRTPPFLRAHARAPPAHKGCRARR